MAVKKKVAAKAKKRTKSKVEELPVFTSVECIDNGSVAQQVRKPSELELAAIRVDIERTSVEFWTRELKRARHSLEQANLELQHAQEHLAEMAMK